MSGETATGGAGRPDPVRPTDDAARAMARGLIAGARHGALGVIDPATGGPMVTRVAVGWDGAAALILVSDLSLHTAALVRDPACSILVGEPGAKGDPLTHPRLTIMARAMAVEKGPLRDAWLADHPKAALWFDFADFRMFRLVPQGAYLNGGFGRAYRLEPGDLG